MIALTGQSRADEAFFAALAQPGIGNLRAYDPGHDLVALRRHAGGALVELGSNENPWGASPMARAAMIDVMQDLHRYPDPLGGDLKQALAAHHGVSVQQLLLGNGSHELLMQFAQVFAGVGHDVVVSQFAFAVYALAAQAAGAPLRVVPALPRQDAMAYGHDLSAIADAVTPATRLVYLANPNNPTGTWLDADAVAHFMAQVPRDVVVVIDEAYAEYVNAPGYASAIGLLRQHPNLVVTRTFSKAFALAGLRVGYAIAHPGLVAVMERVHESFNVNMVGLAAAEAALGDQPHLQRTAAHNAEQRTALAQALRQRGWYVFPSQTNFLLVEFGSRTPDIEAGLLARNIVVRPMGGYGLDDCLRITVGTTDANARLIDALDAIA